VWSAGAVIGGTLYVGSDADAFFALRTADGAMAWRIHVQGDADSGVSVAPDGSLRFTAGTDLYAVSPDGNVRWRFRGGAPFMLSTPAVDDDGTAYVGSIDDRLYAVAPDGRMRWEHRAGGDISSSPVIGDDGTIYFGSDDQSVYALTRDGRLRWRAALGGYVRAPVALGRDGSVLAAVYGPSPRLVALDAATGDVRWYFPVGIDETSERGIASGPLVDVDGNVYFGAQDDYVYSVTSDGRMRWIFDVGADVDAAPILTPEGLLVVGCDGGYVYAIDQATDEATDGAADAGAHATSP
jgi:outer membrane protein assembly factor BamB